MAEEKTARRLFVGGLYDGITQKDLSDRFSRFGEVSGVDIRARKDNLGTILKTFAYLNMSISEKDYKKCMVTFNKTTWRGNEMQIQLAKESFMDRLAREREAAKIQETCPPVKPVVEPVTLHVKGAPPGTAVEGKQDWVVGKYGRALPVVNIRTKNKKKILTVDPSKYVHGVKQFDHGKKAEAMEETDPSPSIEGLTWHLEVEETETLKKIKGEFPKSPKSKYTPQKRKHSPRDDSINGNGESRSMKAYHSNSDSGSSDEEKTPISKKKKSAPKSPDVVEKTSTLVQTPKTPLVNGKRKRTLSDTSSPHDRKDTRSRAISPNVSIIEPQATRTPTKSKVQKPSALDILTQLKLSSQKKVLDVKKCVFDNEISKVTSSKSAADKGVSKNVQLEDKSPMNNKSPAKTKRKSLSSSISETQTTSWSPSIDVGAADQAATPRTPKATDILEKLKLASQRKLNVETTPVSRKRDTSESIDVGAVKAKTPTATDILEKLKRKQNGDTTPTSKKCAESTDVGTDKQSAKPKTPNATDILEKLKRKQNVDTTPTSRKSAESIDVGTDKPSVKPKTPNATDILEKLKRKQNVDTTPTSKKCAETIDVGSAKQSAKAKTPNSTDIMEKLKRKQNLDKTPTSRKSATSETSAVDVLPPKETLKKENKKSTVQLKSQKEDSSSSDSEDEVPVRQSNKKSKSAKATAVLTMETETQEQASQKSKKPKSQKNTPTANTAKMIRFDDDIGVDADDEEDVNSKRPIPKQPVPRRNAMLVQPAFAQVGSVDEFGVGVLVDENTRQLSEQEKKWKRYNSHTYSSDEDILDAAKAGSFTKLERIAHLAQLGQKHIEISTELRAKNQLAPKVYNSDSNSDDEGFKQIQAAPKRTQEKSFLPKVKYTQKMKEQIQNAKSSESDGTSSEDDVETPVQQKIKNNSSASKKKLLVASKQTESSDESSTSASDSEEVVTGKTSTAKSSTNSSESSAEEVEPVKNKSNPPKQKQSESSSDSSESEAEEVTKKPPVQQVKASENVSNGKGKAPANKKLRVDPSESSSESSTSSEEEAKEVKQKPQVQSKKANSPVNKKKQQKGDSPKSSSESSSSSSDEEAVEVKQKPQVVIKKANPVVSKKEVQQEENSTSSSESSTSSDEEVKQVKPKPQVVQSKKNNTPVSKKNAPKEESSSESSTSSDEEPKKSKPAAVKQKISEAKATALVSKALGKAKVAEVPKAKVEKPKLKSKEAVNQLRLESLKLRNQEALAQKNLLKKALASVDANSSNSNKIRFDSESEDEKMKMQDDSSSSDSDSGNDSDTESSDEESQPKPNKDASTKKPALFDDDSDESEDDTEDQFRVRPQFEGEAGSKLIALQSRFGNDPRFKFTEKFLENDNEETAQDSNAEEEMEVTEDSTVTERDRTLAILKGVVGQGDGKKKTKAVLFKDMATQQYDPTKDEHKQFEVQVEKKEKKKKKKEVEVGPEAEALPEVSGDRYFEVQNSLKNMFNKTDDKPFSLLAMLGRTQDEPVVRGFSQQADGMGQVFQHVKSPWQQQFGSDGESSGDEHDEDTSAQPTEADSGTKHQRGSFQSRGSHGFFFVDNDPRIRDGIDFFRRQGDIEHIREKWAQERPDLVEAYRNKRKRFRFMKKEGTTPNYKSGLRGGKRGGGRGGGGRGGGGRR